MTLHSTVFSILTAMVVWGCASFTPRQIDTGAIRAQAVSQTQNKVRVQAAVLGAEETESVFGLPLYQKGVQPIWLEIENNTGATLWVPQVSIDRNYFAPLEVAYMYRTGFSKAAKHQMNLFFHQHALGRAIAAGETRSGFVFTHLALGTKAFNVELIGADQQVWAFTFLIPVAGLKVDYREVDWFNLYPAGDLLPVDTADAFKAELERLPCCTTDKNGTSMADPINVVIIGKGKDLLYALLRSGWDETAAASSYNPMAQLPWEFRYQPVKPLYLFGRPQDAAFRKSRSTLNERNQLRLWLSPYLFEGELVWVGQISRIIRRSVLHQFIIEPDVDEARSFLLQDLWYAQAISKYGYIQNSDVVTMAEPHQSLHDDHYFTDGRCLVMWVSGKPVPFPAVHFMPWETPETERKKMLLGK